MDIASGSQTYDTYGTTIMYTKQWTRTWSAQTLSTD